MDGTGSGGESAGSAVEMEMANATKSVSDVTVIETAALPSAWLTRSAAARARDWMLGRDEVVVKEPPSSMQQLSTALVLMLPASFVVAARSAFMASRKLDSS